MRFVAKVRSSVRKSTCWRRKMRFRKNGPPPKEQEVMGGKWLRLGKGKTASWGIGRKRGGQREAGTNRGSCSVKGGGCEGARKQKQNRRVDWLVRWERRGNHLCAPVNTESNKGVVRRGGKVCNG